MSFPILLNQLSTVGQWMAGTLSLVSLEVTVFALIVWLILRLVRFRSAKVREGFWLTVLFKMVFSLFLAWPISWFIIPGQHATSEDILTSSAPPVEQITQQPDSGTSAVIPLTETSTPSQAVLLVDEVAWWHHLNWRDGLAILWTFGCGLMLVRFALGLRTFGVLRKNTRPVPESLQRTLGLCKEQLKIRSTVNLQLADNISAPMLFGLLRPVILLPSWCVEQFSQPELRLIFIHELAHWKYRDTWVLWVKQLIEAFFFFHPAVWYAGVQVVREAEAACDDLVVALSKESRSYANCLMQILQRAASMKQQTLGGFSIGGNATANRIRKLLEEGSKMIPAKIKPHTIIALIMVALLGLPSWFVPKGDSAETPSSEDADQQGTAIDSSQPAKTVPGEPTKIALRDDEYGAVVWGKGTDIQGEVHISDVSYSGGNFWFQGLPVYLEKWMNVRSKVHINFMPEVITGKFVYLSWPPANQPEDFIQSMSKSVDPEGLFKQPMLLMSSLNSDTKVNFTQAEVENLRKYLIEKEGFLFIDDDAGEAGAFYQSIRSRLRYALPEFPIQPIPNNHEIYRHYYEMGGPPVGSISWMGRQDKRDYLEGIFIGNRMAVLISDRGYWNVLSGRGPYSPGVLRFCTNIVIYAITHGKIPDYSQYTP